ncbi:MULTISPECIES: dienelactone hydrolase family protein [Planktothrix]|jgi:carboxymethylenebutenolidase|uniref:Carboxymethylenebutenolidase n=2 Tax=Planktothrix TaxID=54304 RepID=A0A479ZQS6_PLAAG|nr:MULTISPECIES: dienelactone hydrolase family protein [Planktothrix]GCL34532.1 carboxymethylenebutenolidase [Planktothrix agardhii CCAP 1459/11A]CAC5343734.1 putative carboxymethylenebutenolidase [Planktothrix rubescens NIVA-CYA 18]CAD5960167.1 Putative carboxymethylenebutenolidase [Planktothrix rubescens]CAD5980794.1 Putative carboxymethylenebutenolidase [Planktothrix rubescens NIVA-CYA 18]
MINQPLHTTNVQIPNGDLQIDAYLAQPQGEGPFPAVIVIQEIFGVNSHIRDVTERIAKEGYIAIAPAIYQRFAPGFDVGYTPEDIELGRKYKDQTTAPELLSDIQATLKYLKTLPNLKPKFGTIGFCFGGHVVYLAATLPDIQATACFYGAGIATMTPGGGAPTITRTADIQGVLYGFFGTEDPLIPNEQVDQIETELQNHQIPHQIFRYKTDHGFFCDQRSTYNPQAAQDAWTQVKQIFQQEL